MLSPDTLLVALPLLWGVAVLLSSLLRAFTNKLRWTHRSYFLAATLISASVVYALLALTHSNSKDDSASDWVVVFILVGSYIAFRLFVFGFHFKGIWQDARIRAGLPC